MTRARDLSNLMGSGNFSSTTFTATAGQTVFTIAHTAGFVQVFMNGLLLDLTTDYTSNGSAITLTTAAAVGDEIEVVKYNTFSVGDAIPASGGTFTGSINASSGLVTPAGHVIQTVHGHYGTIITSNTSNTVETGLAVSITPKFSSSKILVTVSQNIQVSGNSYAQIALRRGTLASNTLLSVMVDPEGYNATTAEEINQIPFSWLDSPSTTSATRYFVSMARLSGSYNIYAQTASSAQSVSTMVLQEIAQ